MSNPQRIQELKDILSAIDAAQDVASLGDLYAVHIGYNPFESSDDLEDTDDVRMVLCDFILEVACSEGIHWQDILSAIVNP